MTAPNVPPNAYTNSPKQHPNLILGSLQLLVWLFFRPSAWNNHLASIDPSLHRDSKSPICFPWKKPAFWRLLFQGYIILPVMANLLQGLVLLAWGIPIKPILSSVQVGVLLGVVCGTTIGTMQGLTAGVAVSVGLGVALGGLQGVSVVLMGLGVAKDIALGVALGAIVILWRPIVRYRFLIFWNNRIYELDKRQTHRKCSLLRWNCAFWDEWQLLRLRGLDKHLLLVIERNPAEGKAAIEYLTTSHQRWAAQAAQIELTARKLERCTDVEAIKQAHNWLGNSELESPASDLLRRFNRFSEDVDAALNQASNYNQRLVLRTIADYIDTQLQEFTRSSHPYAPRFYPIAKSWFEIITNYERQLATAVELRQEIDSPYIIGIPLTQQQEIFTGRTEIASRIEQLLLDRRRPPLLLYGQRRMGKTSLLNNLGRLLPNSIIPLFVDLQGPVSSASDHAGLLYNIARGMLKSAQQQSGLTLPTLTRETLAPDPFTCFDEWLDAIEQTLEGSIFLLALDEFEALDKALNDKRFDETAVLGMLRNLIQHRPRFKVLLSGSHTLQEFQRWASYLINVQVVHISYLKESEARQLIEQPVADFTLHFETDAVNRIIALTRSHPFLVQLICAEIVALKNEQNPSMRRLATLSDVEAAIPEALSSGSFFFADLERNQVDENGLIFLRFLAAQGENTITNNNILAQHFPERESILVPLLQRELIEQVDVGYRFQVELIRRWFAK